MRLLLAVLLMAMAALPAGAEDFDRITEAGSIKVGVCLNSEPSGFLGSDGKPKGYDIDVATLMAAELGVTLELVETSSATRITDLLGGRIDVIACNITATTVRARAIDFSFPYLRTGLKLLVRRDAGIGGFDDIGPGTRFLLGRDTTGEALALSRAPDAQFSYVSTPGDALLVLRQGDAYAYIADSLIADYMAKGNPDTLVSLPGSYSVDAIAFGVRKGNPELLRWLDLFASIYVSSGQYAATYGKWWGGEPPPLVPVW